MSKRMSLEELISRIDYDGFDYTFRMYLSADRVPASLETFVNEYNGAADRLESEIRRLADIAGIEVTYEL